MITRADIKLGVRYVVLMFLSYLAYLVVTPEYLNSIKELDSMIVSAVIVSVFGALTLVLKANFDTKPS